MLCQMPFSISWPRFFLIPSTPATLALLTPIDCRGLLSLLRDCLSLSLKSTGIHTPQSATISLCDMLHAPRDPLLISKPPTPPLKTDFRSPKQNCPQRTISTKLLRMSWWAVSLICLSSQSSPGIHSCLLRLSESTLENITRGRGGGGGGGSFFF